MTGFGAILPTLFGVWGKSSQEYRQANKITNSSEFPAFSFGLPIQKS